MLSFIPALARRPRRSAPAPPRAPAPTLLERAAAARLDADLLELAGIRAWLARRADVASSCGAPEHADRLARCERDVLRAIADLDTLRHRAGDAPVVATLDELRALRLTRGKR